MERELLNFLEEFKREAVEKMEGKDINSKMEFLSDVINFVERQKDNILRNQICCKNCGKYYAISETTKLILQEEVFKPDGKVYATGLADGNIYKNMHTYYMCPKCGTLHYSGETYIEYVGKHYVD